MKRIGFLSLILFVIAFNFPFPVFAEDGYDLWLRYKKINNAATLRNYQSQIHSWHTDFSSTTSEVINNELRQALPQLLNKDVAQTSSIDKASIILTTLTTTLARTLKLVQSDRPLHAEGYLIRAVKFKGRLVIAIAGQSETGTLYGMFHFLRMIQTQQDLNQLNVFERPALDLRMLDHWDNLDRTVERGYAGMSIFDWQTLPGLITKRYRDYARANASIGINGTVLTNVNANAVVLTDQYISKVKALADVFRPYGIKVYLTARFSAPMEIGGLSTADPLNEKVQAWWNEKVRRIYASIPDFGGFLVKANSEGQPGPQNFNRSHADGANMLARALKPFNGIVMWRAFVYNNDNKTDRAKQAYEEFKPLDGQFADNVIIQVKNGPIDFQPREPFHPLFGSMPKTRMMAEFQITQEYLGFSSHLVYLAPLFSETLLSDTFIRGEGSLVGKVVDGTLYDQRATGIAGVANIGNEPNWCGHHFAQSNWYAFGRLAWNYNLTPEAIADEWIKMTFTNDKEVVKTILPIMLSSRETAVSYMTPLGLHHIMGWDHHYGPAPWIAGKPRADWTSVYYHKADSAGIGFNRTATGSNAVEQYAEHLREIYGDITTCPEKYLLWFHHASWEHKLANGSTLWNALCDKYDNGVKTVDNYARTWNTLEGKVDSERFDHVRSLLHIQTKEAQWWRDACTLYFQQFSRRPFPSGFEAPLHELKYYQELEFPFAPGIKPKW